AGTVAVCPPVEVVAPGALLEAPALCVPDIEVVVATADKASTIQGKRQHSGAALIKGVARQEKAPFPGARVPYLHLLIVGIGGLAGRSVSGHGFRGSPLRIFARGCYKPSIRGERNGPERLGPIRESSQSVPGAGIP